MQPLVLDTNLVLDVFVFADEAARPVLPRVQAGGLRWIATATMREELRRVLDYPKLAPRLAFHAVTANHVLAHFDRHAQLVPEAQKAPCTCKDPDDQKFIDLAFAHGAVLLSKDRAVLALRKRLAMHGVRTAAAWGDVEALPSG